ncbi:MAG: hypothetical protein SFU53_12280 [Terrimicrobiaceae bacterium]|nr:hypothetical protein [Terrimicrobiaceae bacterium]
MWRWLLLVSLVIAAHGQEVRRAIPVGTTNWDEQAKFIGGVPIESSSELAALQKRGSYTQHSAQFEKLWVRYRDNYFGPMRQWSYLELTPRIRGQAPVLYFFGGPDVLSVLALYPEATDFLLGGLEPVYPMPAVQSLEPAARETALANVRNSTDVILSFGHFITKEMKADFDATELKGVVPVMLALLAISGAEVLDVAPFFVLRDGQAVDGGTVAGAGLPGVRFTFRMMDSPVVRRIHYVQANVANDALKSNDSVLAWARAYGQGNVYLKAASYLMHESYFSTIRSFLLEQGQSVLQDDSGIPFAAFRDGAWRLWFFGVYAGTLEIFAKYQQPDLGTAFAAAGVPLPFGTGYKWQRGQSNLLLAVKQEAPRAIPVTEAPVQPTGSPPPLLPPVSVEPEVVTSP